MSAIASYGVRRNEKWAYHTFLITGVAGFSMFGLFFLYHDIDIGNVAVAAVLLAVLYRLSSFNIPRH